MPLYGTIDALVDYAQPSTSSYVPIQAVDNDSGLAGLEILLADKVKCLGDILNDIASDIQRRVELSRNVLGLISQHYCYIKTKLIELYRWLFGGSRSIETRRVRLEQQLDTLNNEERQELVSAWQDVAALKKEFRTWFKQYCDLAQRVRLLLPGHSDKPTHLPQISPAMAANQMPRAHMLSSAPRDFLP